MRHPSIPVSVAMNVLLKQKRIRITSHDIKTELNVAADKCSRNKLDHVTTRFGNTIPVENITPIHAMNFISSYCFLSLLY